MEAALLGLSSRTTLGPTVLTIGRAPDNQLVINDSQVSGHHAEIRPEGKGYCILDLGSLNRTFINEYQLISNTARSLNHGDRIRFGKNIVYTYEVNGVPQLTQTARADATVRGNPTELNDQPAVPSDQVQAKQQVPPGLMPVSQPQRQQANLNNYQQGQANHQRSRSKKPGATSVQVKVARISAIGAIVVAVITAILAPIIIGRFTNGGTTTTTTSMIPRLHNSYTGSRSVTRSSLDPGQYTSTAPLMFSSIIEDDQGQIQSAKMVLGSAEYICQGSVNTSRNLILTCNKVSNKNFHELVNGHVSQDSGQLSGTLNASNTLDPSFYQDSTWYAQG